MKYVVQWVARQNADEQTQARGLQVFSKWTPPDGVQFHEFVGRVDGGGGFAVVETEDVTLLARINAVFAAFWDIDVYPVLEIQEAARIGG